MSDFESFKMEVHGHPVTLREYGRTDWVSVLNRLRRLSHTEGYTWFPFQEYSLDKIDPGVIRKKLRLREGESLQVAQFWDMDAYRRIAREVNPNETSVNRIGVKRIRQKNDGQKKLPETFRGWHTWLRLTPPEPLSPRAAEYQAKYQAMLAKGRQDEAEARERPALTEAERWQMELDSMKPWEAREAERARMMERRQKWVDERQSARENEPKAREEAIRIQQERANAGSPIKRRNA